MSSHHSLHGKKIYFSFSILGVPDDRELARKAVDWLIESGADVLSEHVVYPLEKMNEVRKRKSGIDVMEHDEPWKTVRKLDMEWVDEADMLVAFVNSPSHGVGMEIERALTRHERGMKPCIVIAFSSRENIENLTWMIRGIERWNFFLVEYDTFEDISNAITNASSLIPSERCVVFPIRDGKILIGKRKESFGKGLYVGFGGKVERETLEECALRELEEEAGIVAMPGKMRKIAENSYVFPEKPEWNQHVSYFVIDEWKGSEKETDEIIPEWFSLDNIPYEKMFDDAKYWMPHALSGKHGVLRGAFIYDNDGKAVKEFHISFHDS